jgi:5-methylcytosine-specific restriction endonuclease McrA
MERKNDKKYSIEEVLSRVVFDDDKNISMVDFDGDLISMNSHRYQTFKVNGIRCHDCKIEGKYFVKERHSQDSRWHFNLYALKDDGKEILLTKDHIVPIVCGGRNILSNYRTMCYICNCERSKVLLEEPGRILQRVHQAIRLEFKDFIIQKDRSSKWVVLSRDNRLLTNEGQLVDTDSSNSNTRFSLSQALKLVTRGKNE